VFRKAIFAWAFRHTGRLIALNAAMSAELRSIWHVPDHRIMVIPNGVTLHKDANRRPEPTDPPAILCVGRLQPQKDHDTLLRAFAHLAERRPCRLLLAGDGPLQPKLERLAATLGIADRVEFLGHVEDPGPLYAMARLTVLASRFEGFPNVLIEALAHGCPVVSTDCPTGPADVIDSPEIGLLARVGDPSDLAEKLDSALDHHFDPSFLLARAEHFSMDRLQECIIAAFEARHRQDIC
jgi:glycosyltransferase involved in cell wall biosynthesis